jgi:thiamine-phosphate pyrophosphorylase
VRFPGTLYLLVAGPEGVREAIDGGVDVVQMRDKDSPDPLLRKRIAAVKAITDETGVPLIINDRPDLCAGLGAAGVHLGQEDMSVAEARAIVGPDSIIGISTHTLEEVDAAQGLGVDYIAIGPVYATPSKDTPVAPLGPGMVAQVVVRSSLPVVAIGGITPGNIHEVMAAGVGCVAVIGGILGGGDPRENAMALRAGLDGARTK